MKILVLAGGNSNEREVSLTSGAAVCESLRRLGHEVIALDPASGQSLLESDGKFLDITKRSEMDHGLPEVTKPRALAKTLAAAGFEDIDVVFIALHGGTGENGTVQNLLQLAGKRYTGSDMTASAVAMNKAMAKRLMASIGVPTPRWQLWPVPGDASATAIAGEISRQFDLPVIIKPNDGGSTIGLTKVNTADEISSAVVRAGEHSSQVLVEEYVPGRELTVSVFDGRAYPVVEIKPLGELYDYEAKYTKGKSQYNVPAQLDDGLARDMQKAAVDVYRVIGATSLARVDFILGESGGFYCLELNTLPGMTSLSLAPMALKCEGVGFDRLIEMMIQSALKQQD